MSRLGYDLAYAGHAPFEGDEGMESALYENLKKFRLSGVHYTPNMISHEILRKLLCSHSLLRILKIKYTST